MIVTNEVREEIKAAIKSAFYTDYQRGERPEDDEIAVEAFNETFALDSIIEILEKL